MTIYFYICYNYFINYKYFSLYRLKSTKDYYSRKVTFPLFPSETYSFIRLSEEKDKENSTRGDQVRTVEFDGERQCV